MTFRVLLSIVFLVGDKGYFSQKWQNDIFQSSSINLQTPMRKNQLNYKELLPSYRKARKRIETLFSQLCEQFMVRRNYAKFFEGISRRIVIKITALTLIQWVKFSTGKKLNNLEIVIS